MSNEQQARKDAMADAETLLSVSCDYGLQHSTGLLLLDSYARQVVFAIGAANSTTTEHETWAAECAERNARAAFRAVPALRGDR